MAAIYVGPNGPLYWDSFGYLTQALRGDVGGLMLGRPAFVYASYWIAQAHFAAGGSVWTIEPVLRACWLLVSCLAAPLTFELARAVKLSTRAALFAGLVVALSPAFAHTSNAVLTDGPALTLTLLSLVLACRGVERARDGDGAARRESGAFVVTSAAVLGLACGVRETAVLNLPILALILWRVPRVSRARVATLAAFAFVASGALPVLWAWMHQPGYVGTIRAWQASMAEHRLEKTYGWHDAGYAVAWTFALGPLAAVGAAVAWWRDRRVLFAWPVSILGAVVIGSLAQMIFFAGYLDIAYSPRYLLPALPGALAIPAATTLDRWSASSSRVAAALMMLLVVPIAIGGALLQAREADVLRNLRALRTQMAALPSGSTVVTGQMCPGIAWLQEQILKERAESPAWNTVCPGWAWPDDLEARLDAAVRDGRTLVIDLRPASWPGDEQQAALEQVRRYVDGRRPHAVIWR